MRSKFISDSDTQKIRKVLPVYYRDVFDVMCFTGLRIGDVVSLKFGDLDEKGYVHFIAHKTGKHGRAKLPDDIFTLLQRSQRGEDEYIFPSPTGKKTHISRQAVWKNIKKACRKCGVNPDGVSPHSCRKRFAVNTYKEKGFGKTMASLQHNSPTTTFMYVFEENPLESIQKEVQTLQKQVQTLRKEVQTLQKKGRKLLKKIIFAVDLCCDKLIGDDRYGVTDEGRKALEIDLSELDGNIL